MIEKLRVLICAEVVGEFSSSEFSFSADSFLVSVPPSVTTVAHERCWITLSKVQMAGYT